MDPLLLDIPEQLFTPRLVIRNPRPGEGAATNQAVAESFAELTQWMPWAREMPTVEETEIHTRRAHARFYAREDLSYRAWLLDGGMLAVGSGLHRIDWTVPKFEIGYWVRSSLAGNGYVSEVVNALTSLAFEQLSAKRVEIRMDERNHRSIRVAERCGFALEGTLRNDSIAPDGGARSTRIYSKIAP